MYSKHFDNKLVRRCLDFTFYQMLDVHRQPFLLQLFASAAPLLAVRYLLSIKGVTFVKNNLNTSLRLTKFIGRKLKALDLLHLLENTLDGKLIFANPSLNSNPKVQYCFRTEVIFRSSAQISKAFGVGYPVSELIYLDYNLLFERERETLIRVHCK